MFSRHFVDVILIQPGGHGICPFATLPVLCLVLLQPSVPSLDHKSSCSSQVGLYPRFRATTYCIVLVHYFMQAHLCIHTCCLMQSVSVGGIRVLLECVPFNCLLLPPPTCLPHHAAGGTTVLLTSTPSPITPRQNTVAQE